MKKRSNNHKRTVVKARRNRNKPQRKQPLIKGKHQRNQAKHSCNKGSLRKICREFLGKYFQTDSEIYSRLSRWNELPSIGIPDSGADFCMLAGQAWVTSSVPGEHDSVTIGAYMQPGQAYKPVRGLAAYLDPEGQPLAILRVNWGAAVPDGGETSESLFSEAQLSIYGVQIREFGGIKQLHHAKWPFPIHCLPRGGGHFVPIRRPTKDEMAYLPYLDLTENRACSDDMLRKQVGLMVSTLDAGKLVKDQDLAAKGQTTNTKVRPMSERNRKKRKQKGDSLPPPATGPSSETKESVAKALAAWSDIFAGINMQQTMKNLRANTTEAVAVSCERRTIPKDTYKTRFPFLRPRFLGEAVFTDTIEWKSQGRKCYGQTYLCQQSGYPYYTDLPRGLKGMEESYTEFINAVGVPTVMISDGHKSENQSKKVQKLSKTYRFKLKTTEAYKPWQNKVERLNGWLKSRATFIKNKSGVPTEYTGYLYKFLCHLFKHTAKRKLGDHTPEEALTGETGDISHLRFPFWHPIWYKSQGTKYPDAIMLKGRYLGPSESTGDELAHLVLPDKRGKNERRPEVISRSYVTIRDPREQSFGEIITDHRREFLFPKYLCPSRYDRQGQPWNVRKLLDKGSGIDPELAERAHKRQKVQNAPDMAGPQDETVEAAKPAFGKAQLLHEADALRNETQSLEAGMNPDELIDYEILRHTMRNNLLTLDVRYLPTGEVLTKVPVDEVKIDAPFALAGYINKTGVGRRNKLDIWKWAKRTLRLQTEIIRRARLYVSSASTDDITGGCGAQRINRTRRAKAKTPNKKKHHKGPVVMFGVTIPRTVEEAYALDKENGDTQWSDAIKKELDAIMKYGTVYFPPTKAESDQLDSDIKSQGFQYAKTWLIFAAKQDLRRKARLVLGGHMVNYEGVDTFSSHMSPESARVLMVLADLNGYKVAVGDINNAYLYATMGEKIFTEAGEAFVKAGYAKHPKQRGKLIRAQYGGGSCGHEWYILLAQTLREMGFVRTRGDPDVWIRPNGTQYYDYIGTHTDDLLVVSIEPEPIYKDLERFYSFKTTTAPKYHLGVDYVQIQPKNGKVSYQLGSFTYVKEAIAKSEGLILAAGHELPHDMKVPAVKGDQPELDDTPVCSDEDHKLYMQLIGIFLWVVLLGRIDMGFAVSSLSRFSALPREGHLKRAINIVGYMKRHPDRRIAVDSRPMELPASAKPMRSDSEKMKEMYPDAKEEIDPKFPAPRGKPISTTVIFDANNAHDKASRRSIEGYMTLVGRTLIKGKPRRQTSIAQSSYLAELHAGRTASEEAMSLRYLLRSFGVKIDGPTKLLGDNEGSLINVTEPNSTMAKKHVGVSYHTSRECEAADITRRYHVATNENSSDGLTKALNSTCHYQIYKPGGPVFCVNKDRA